MRSWSLRNRVLLVVGAAVVVPILVVAAAFSSRRIDQRQASVRAHIQSVATRLCTAADVYLDKHRTAMEGLAASMAGVPLRPDASLHQHLEGVHRVYAGFRTMLVADATGRVVSVAPLRAPDGSSILTRINTITDREYFAVPMRDRTSFISEAFLGRGFGTDPIVAISAPVIDRAGDVAGIVEGSMNLGAFESLRETVPGMRDLDYVLVDRSERVIFSNFEPALPALSSLSLTPMLRAARLARGSDVFTYAAASTAGGDPLPHLAARCQTANGWKIFASQSLAAVEAETIREYLVIAVWTLVALLVALAAAATMARSITRPLDTLSTAVGAFHPHGAVPSIVRTGSEPSEIALLLDRFNEMAQRANASDRGMQQALHESERVQAELAHVLGHREAEVALRTAELAARTEELASANAKLELQASTDPLTGLANRRAMIDAVALAWRAAARERAPISVLAVDVDHFKGYNDALGHPAGDVCLQRIARALEEFARRPLDRAGRSGGEEFVVLLFGNTNEAAIRVAERLRRTIEKLDIPHPGAPSGRVTVSVGVATEEDDFETSPDVLFERADTALYEAKRGGRNRVVASGQRPAEVR